MSAEQPTETTIHGVFMDVLGLGVLITGESGLGKSELALGLINRGQRLVADDAPQFRRCHDDILMGSSPAILQDFLEVRGLGVLNIRALFGDRAIKARKALHFIVHLMAATDIDFANSDRLIGIQSHRHILNIAIAQVTIPVAPGRSLAVLVETAVRNEILKCNGYNACDDFIRKQKQAMEQETI